MALVVPVGPEAFLLAVDEPAFVCPLRLGLYTCLIGDSDCDGSLEVELAKRTGQPCV